MLAFKTTSVATAFSMFLACNLALAAPASDQSPNPLFRRAGTGSGILGVFLSKEFAQVFGSPPGCCDGYDENDCYSTKGTADSGDDWELCFGKGDYVWLQDDANTANCLTNLHYTQDDACISVAGSSCEAGKGTSKILNAQVSYIIGSKQIDSADSDAIQSASNALVGSSVDSGSDLDGGVTLAHAGQNGEYVNILFRFGGGQQC